MNGISSVKFARLTAGLNEFKPTELLISSINDHTVSSFIIINYLKLWIVSTDEVFSSKFDRFFARIQFSENEYFPKYIYHTQMFILYTVWMLFFVNVLQIWEKLTNRYVCSIVLLSVITKPFLYSIEVLTIHWTYI